MFPFQNLEVYKKSKLFHLHCKEIILTRKLDSYVRDQLERASFSVPLNIAEVRTGRDMSLLQRPDTSDGMDRIVGM